MRLMGRPMLTRKLDTCREMGVKKGGVEIRPGLTQLGSTPKVGIRAKGFGLDWIFKFRV